jgi:Uma2 family endonuclease
MSHSRIDSRYVAMNSAALRRLSVDDYLAIERSAEMKSEFYDGEMFAMAGGSKNHNIIAVNLIGELRAALKGRPCQVFGSDMRVKVPSGLYTYPDVGIVCGGTQMEGKSEDTLLNPVVLIEVLSDSTEDYDRGRKAKHYWSIPSLKEYILVSQNAAQIDRVVRETADRWTTTNLASLNGALSLAALNVSIPLAEIYANVEWPTEPAAGEDNHPKEEAG